MKSKEEKVIEHLPKTPFNKYQNVDSSKDGGYHGIGFVFIPLSVFIGILYWVFS